MIEHLYPQYPASAKIRHRHRRMRRFIERLPSRRVPEGTVVELPRAPACDGFPGSYVLTRIGCTTVKNFEPPDAYRLDRASVEHPDGYRVVATQNGSDRWIRVPAESPG